MKEKRTKKWISAFIGGVLAMSLIAGSVPAGKKVEATSSGTYEVNLPEGTVTNKKAVEESLQFIDVTYTDATVGGKLQDAITIKDGDGNTIPAIYFSVDGKVRIPVSNFKSNKTYTLSITPEELNTYEKIFTTGTIVDDTDVADGLIVTKKWKYPDQYSVIDLLRGYDLDSVKICSTDNIGGEVYLTRDIKEDFDEMTKLGKITSNDQSFAVEGYDIGKYQYVVVKGSGTIQSINAYVSSESMKGIKARPVGGSNVDLRFGSFSDLHIQQIQREATNMTDVLVKAKSEKFGGHLDAMVLVGDIHYMYPDSDVYNAQMLNRYARIEAILTENGYGYSNLDNDSDDIIPTIYAAGNHEYSGSANNDVHAQRFVDQVDSFNSHKVINGYHFIAGSSNYEAQMTKEVTDWMKAEIEKAVASDSTGTKPIFVFAHTEAAATTNQMHDKVQNYYYPGKSAEFKQWLKNYPQVIVLSGHTHNLMQQQTTINQVGFTQISLGHTGGGNANWSGRSDSSAGGGETVGFYRQAIDKMKGGTDYHPQGAIVEVKNNVAYVYKIDFRTGEQIGDPWVIDTEGLTNGTARAYYTSERYEYSVAPHFEEGAETKITVAEDYATITFPQAKCNGNYGDEYAMVYQIHTYVGDSTEIHKSIATFSDVLYWTNNYEMPEMFTMKLPDLEAGTYRIEITALNSFEKASELITTTITIPASSTE